MKMKEFLGSLAELRQAAEVLPIDASSRVVIMSDLHLGDGSAKDDSLRNGRVVEATLRDHYFERGYTLVLNGDVEDLHKASWADIRAAHPETYAILNRFAAAGRLRKLLGNHDLELLRAEGYPYRLEHSLRLEPAAGSKDGFPQLLVFHGHQAATFFTRFNYLSDFIVRFIAKPLGIKNADLPMTSKRRFRTERRIYAGARKLGLVAVTGHTHRPLFESLGKYDALRFSIEANLRRYAEAAGMERTSLGEKVRALAEEFRSLSAKKRRNKIRRSLYAVGEPVLPCLFNSGCTTGKSGITALEIEDGALSLIHWTDGGRAKPYLAQEARTRSFLGDTDIVRHELARDSLSYIGARMELLR